MTKAICTIDGCDNPTRARGWCSLHYQRWTKHGDPLWSHPVRGAGAEQRFRLRVDSTTTPDGCWLWTGYIGKGGYGLHSTGSRAGGTFQARGAHVFALEQGLGRLLLPGMQCGHTCDVPACVRNDDAGFYEVNGTLRPRRGHLWEGTTQDNTADRQVKGREASGVRNGDYLHPERLVRGETQWLAKLTESQVREIRRRAAAGATVSTLAAEYGVVKTNIYKIVKRQSWRHVA